MSNEAKVIEETEESLIDLLATQSEEVEDTVEEIDVDTDDIEILKERIAKRNKSLKKSKQANHRIQEENAAMLARMEELEKKIPSTQPVVEAEKREQTEAYEKLLDSVNDNPSLAVGLIKETQDKMVDFLARQEAEYEAKIAALRNEFDPEKGKYRDDIARLRSNPELKDMDDDSLIKFIKASSGITPRGVVGGRKASVVPDPEAINKETREKYRKMFEGSM